jgi:GTP-binding protein
MSGIVAIVGRPNVGKSTLFNRLIGKRQAIVDDHSGVTRDRHYGQSDWNGRGFTVVDTGGYVPNSQDIFETGIREQVLIAIEEADVLLFMVDVATGTTDLDLEFAKILRKTSKQVVVVVNKVDNHDRLSDVHEFYSLGFEHMKFVSSMSGGGTGELLDLLVKLLPDTPEIMESDLPKVAIVGRPNVGKSSLCNVFLGENRNMVTDIAGTTRDTIHSLYNNFGHEFILLDTAGVRKKSKVSENIEFYSVMRSLRAVENCDVAMLVLDAQLGLEAQDLNLFGLAARNGKGIVILVNKWDLAQKETNTIKEYTKAIQDRLAPFNDVPILFVSALTKQRVFKAVEAAMHVYNNLEKRIPTAKLNDFILPVIENRPPPAKKGKYIKIKYATQLPKTKGTFVFFCNLPQYIGDSYKRFLENRLREKFDFSGVPLKLFFRKK